MRNTRVLVCSATLWDPSGGLPIRSDSYRVASLYQRDWTVQYLLLEPKRLSGPLTILYVQVLEKDSEGRLDVSGWDSALHNR